jgi:tetratricopeptide (TPR) repeat protein
MKLAAPLALCLLAAGCAGPAAKVRGGGAVTARPDLIPLDRAILAVEAAELKGTVVALRQQYAAQHEAKAGDATARFLSLYSRPRDEATWAEFKAMSMELQDSGLGWLGQARIYVAWKVWDQVEKVVDAGFEQEPDNWLLVIPRAQAWEGRGRFDRAAADWKMVLDVDPKNPQALAGRGRAALRAGDRAAARTAFSAALEAAPDYLPALLASGELADAAKDKEGVVAWTRKAVEASPGDRALRVSFAKLLLEQKDAPGAVVQLKAAVGIKEDTDGLVALAVAARAALDVQTEEKAIERLAAIDPGAGQWKRVAEIRIASGDVAGAEAALRRILSRDAKDAAANAAMGKIQEGKKQYQAALESYRMGGDAARPARSALEKRLNVEAINTPDVKTLQKVAGNLIEKTYRASLAEWPNLSGGLKVRVTVDPDGKATVVEVIEDSLEDPSVRACAYWNLHDAVYPPKKPGRFTFAFALRPPR